MQKVEFGEALVHKIRVHESFKTLKPPHDMLRAAIAHHQARESQERPPDYFNLQAALVDSCHHFPPLWQHLGGTEVLYHLFIGIVQALHSQNGF